MRVVEARAEPSLGARVVARTPLFYARGPDGVLDRPAHVRAGSALARVAPHTFAVVQDDASFIAVLEGIGAGGEVVVHDVPLPSHEGARQFDDHRGNKRSKLDLEACVALEGGALLLALGSGSGTTELRERVVLVEKPAEREPRVTVVHAHALFAAMRDTATFCGSELNIEGAADAGDDILFFQRGNGASVGARSPVDATARIDRAALLAHLRDVARVDARACPCPPLRDVVEWQLGSVAGTRLTFTDGARRDASWFGFLACAEASPDATRDGPVSGVSIGRLDDRRGVAELAPVTDERGSPLLDKAEGLAFDDVDPRRAWLVVDRDDPRAPAEVLELRLGGGWQT